MSSVEHELHIAIEKVQKNSISYEDFKNEVKRLTNAVELEIAPILAAGQGNYARYLHGILDKFKSLESEFTDKSDSSAELELVAAAENLTSPMQEFKKILDDVQNDEFLNTIVVDKPIIKV